MSRLVTGAFVALMVLGFAILLTYGRLDEGFMVLADYLRGHGQAWIWGSLAVIWGAFAVGMVFSVWQRRRLFRLIGQVCALPYLLFLVFAATQYLGKRAEPDLVSLLGLGLSGLGTLFFFLDEINEHFKRGEIAEA